MKASLYFDFEKPEDRDRHSLMLKANDMQYSLDEFSNALRSLYKHGGHGEIKTDEDGKVSITEIRDLFHELLGEFIT